MRQFETELTEHERADGQRAEHETRSDARTEVLAQPRQERAGSKEKQCHRRQVEGVENDARPLTSRLPDKMLVQFPFARQSAYGGKPVSQGADALREETKRAECQQVAIPWPQMPNARQASMNRS